MSLLTDSCENGDINQVINLIEHGYEVNEPDDESCASYIAFARQAFDPIGSQADINVQAQDGYD